MKKYLLLATLAQLATAIAADLPAPPVQPKPDKAVVTDEFKDCQFVTNDCELCVVEPAGKVSCSSVGAACIPTKKWCLVPNPKN